MRVLGLMLAILAIVPPLAHGQDVTPDRDPFYAAPDALASKPNGTVVKARAVAVPIPTVQATQLQYRSTDAKGKPIAPVTTLLQPQLPYLGHGPRPLIAFQAGYDGLGAQCRPSYALQSGSDPDLPQLVTLLLQYGYAVAATDYEGPGDAWMAGPLAGHVVLDGIRAAQSRMDGAATPTAMYGYSGGGQATAFAVQQLEMYAPELSIAGAAAGGLSPDPAQLIAYVDGTPASGVTYAVLTGLERQFPELYVDRWLNDDGRSLRAGLAGSCGEEIATSAPGRRMTEEFRDPSLAVLQRPRVQRVFQDNRLGATAPDMPVYLFHSAADERVPVAGMDALATAWCDGGAHVFYQRAESGDHVGTEAEEAPAAFAFLQARLQGGGAPGNCGTAPPATIASFCPGGATTKFRLHRIYGERIVRAVVRDEAGRRVLVRRGEALRRVVVRHLTPGHHRFTVTRASAHYERTRAFRRTVVCKTRAI